MSLARTIARNKDKLLYKKFQKSWNKEQAYQLHLLSQGKELGEGQQLLRRKPTFSMWLAIAKTQRAKASAQPAEVQEFADENDLAWNEDEGETPQEK